MDRTHPQPAPGGPSRVLALGLLSGGLDSALAAALLLEQGLEVVGLHLESPVSCRGDARGLAAELGIPLIVRAKGEEFLQLLRRPRWGYGRHLNPCLDCRVLMLRRAGEVMRETGAGFVFTGEVPGQRPMSQLRDRMRLVDRQSGLEGLVLRPLSARLLPETEPERRGWVDRTRLLAVSGRSRRVQLAEAARLGERAYAALGCAGVARVDFRLTPENRVVFLEVNTVPGMTETSLVPMAARARGIAYEELVERLVASAMAHPHRCRA